MEDGWPVNHLLTAIHTATQTCSADDKETGGQSTCVCSFLPSFVQVMPPAAKGFSVPLGQPGDRNGASAASTRS
eukprot:1197209-Pleurochrysis_carterae.AAC.1